MARRLVTNSKTWPKTYKRNFPFHVGIVTLLSHHRLIASCEATHQQRHTVNPKPETETLNLPLNTKTFLKPTSKKAALPSRQRRLMLPVSSPWLTALDSMQEGVSTCCSPLKGLLDEMSSQIQEPFWCRQIRNLFSDKLSSNIKKWVLPVVNTGRLGGKPNSPLVNVNHYNTMAWSKFPCSCQYK